MKQLLGGVLLAVALFGSGYLLGDKQASSTCIANQAKAQQGAQVEADETSTRREQVAQSREASRERIRYVYRTIKEKADENPVAADCGLDDAGLRQWNAANSGEAATLSGVPDYTLLVAATGQIGTVGRLKAEPYRGNGAVRAMPGSTGKAGGMREGR